MNKNIPFFTLPALFLSFFLTAGCTGAGDSNDLALLSNLINNRLIVILKGTYATDRPLARGEINNNTLFSDADDPADLSGLPSYADLPIYLDIGEVRLSTKNFLDPLVEINSPKAAEDFWDVVSTTRQVYCSQPYAVSLENDSCYDTGGLINFIEYTNGRGALYPSRDVGPGTYLHAGVFMRGMVTGFARADGAPLLTRFDNNEVLGANIMTRVNYDPGLSIAERQILVPQFFPLHHVVTWGQQTTMVVDSSNSPLVLEIRSNLMENLMVHTFVNSQAKTQTIVAFSDWRKPHAGEDDMGGNILTRARIFNPVFTSDVRIGGGTASSRHYYAVYIQNECADLNGVYQCDRNDWLPLAATPVRNGTDNILSNLQQGSYVLQCRYDNVPDGYPEAVLGEVVFELGTGPGVVDVTCACGSSTTTGCN